MSESKQKVPTAGLRTIEKDGFHKKFPVRSYAILLCEIGGSRVKAVRLDEQVCWTDAVKTALQDNPGWRFKRCDQVMDRDFEEGEQI